MATHSPPQWRLRLNELGLTVNQKGEAIHMILKMAADDRDAYVDADPAVAKVTVLKGLAEGGRYIKQCPYS